MFGRYALTLADNGYHPIPIEPHAKKPAVPGWSEAASAATLEGWVRDYPDCGVGLLCGRIVAIDIDVLDYEAAARLEALATAILGPTPLWRIGQAPKRLALYRPSANPSNRAPTSSGSAASTYWRRAGSSSPSVSTRSRSSPTDGSARAILSTLRLTASRA